MEMTHMDYTEMIDTIDGAVSAWFEKHNCSTAKDDNADEHINQNLCGNYSGHGLENGTEMTAEEITEAVQEGLDDWFGGADKNTVEYYDQLSVQDRTEWRDGTASDDVSLATWEQINAIDAGKKAPILS
jgi:hypothetical protein